MEKPETRSLYTCEIISSKKLEDFVPVSADYILSRFIPISELGIGAQGLTFKVIDVETNEVSAMKSRIMEYDSFDEIRIGCLLYPTRSYTHSIIMPELWTLVDKPVFLDGDAVLTNWIALKSQEEIISNESEKLGLIFTMPIMDDTLENKYSKLSSDEKKTIFFELIIALIALRCINVIHNDLHGSNILIKKTNEYRSYTINNIQHLVTSKYMPVIIDFGIATNLPKQTHFAADWNLMVTNFLYILPYEMVPEVRKANAKILLDPFFQSLREQQVFPEALVRIFAPISI